MNIKVHVQFISPEGKNDKMFGPAKAAVHNGVLQVVRDAAGAKATVVAGYNDRSAYHMSRGFMEAYNNVGMMESLFQAQEQGADVVLIACGNDPTLYSAREALDIPVVGITESGMLLACILGKRFAMVGIEEGCASLVERNLETYGLVDRAIRRDPVRTADLAENTILWFEQPELVREHVIPRFEEAAFGAIEDGAEVIVTSCGALAALTLNGYSKVTGTDVPVVESVLAGSYMAGMLGTLRKRHSLSTSKHRTFKGLPPEVIAHFLAPFRE